MKRIVLALALPLLLAGCGNEFGPLEQDTPEGVVDYYEVEDDNGNMIPCVVYDAVRSGGITCDWN